MSISEQADLPILQRVPIIPVPLRSTKPEELLASLQETMRSADHNVIITAHSKPEEVVQRFAQVDEIYADADGTLLQIGGDRLPTAHAEYILALHELGVRTTMVTGKPQTEIEPIMRSLPQGFPMRVIFEKGAYFLYVDGSGGYHREYLLSSQQVEQRVTELRDKFARWSLELERQENFKFAPAGHGTHRSVLSIDLLHSEATEAKDLVLRSREKINDPVLLGRIKEIVRAYLHSEFPDCKLIDLGNANWEMTVGEIDKDQAIESMPGFADSRGVMLWGDSGNDVAMFKLRRHAHVAGGVVWHEQTPTTLLSQADFVSVGVMNTGPFFRKIIEAKQGLMRQEPSGGPLLS